LEDFGGRRLAVALLENQSLKVCHVSNNKLSSDVADLFAEVIMKSGNLKDLDLSNNLFIMDELQTLA
jgi:Ran GTPase-activating protein (RanGAP) involved in mRNA processing and transport